MKLNLTNVKRIKSETNNKLTKHVCDWVVGRWGDYDNKKSIFSEVLNYGCQSGIVGELIYYSDTLRFYKRYRDEINELLYDCFNEMGVYSPADLFGKKWDKEDMLALETNNQNLLAWFGFEETLRNIAYNFDELQSVI